jgi:serine/threonine protein phosphatase PrpC
MITIKSEDLVTDKGKREMNEDSFKYKSGNYYLVCDGVGGNRNGEIVSGLLASSIDYSLSKLNTMDIIYALKEAEKVIENHKKKYPKTKQMASTMAITQITGNSILIAWVGDSRVYQFRDGKIKYKTTDHTLVSEYIKKGILTEVEALFHPDANKLTRSIKGESQPAQIEQITLTDVKENDCFLLCSDGILESWIDSDLEELFSKSKSSSFIIKKINENCNLYSNDNFTAIVYQVGFV